MGRGTALRLAYWNGALWAIGNGLLGSPLVIYLAQDFRVPRIGLGIGLILAAPYLVGLLRLGAPAMIGRLADRKPFCVTAYILSGLVLAIVPGVAWVGDRLSPRAALALLVAGWCGYHLLEYLATVALWSWLADLCPRRVRGRFLGSRERWMTLGQAAAMLSGGLYVWGWTELHPLQPRWAAYIVPAAMGVGFLIAAIVPLLAMPEGATHAAFAASLATRFEARRKRRGENAEVGPSPIFRSLMQPLADRRFLAVLAVFCWFSLVNGMIASPQSLFPNQVLKLGLFSVLALKVGMRLGQWPLGPGVGWLADRYGNRLVLALGYLIVAQAPLFYFVAGPAHWQWIIGAWICWIAWIGANVGMPNLLLKIAPPRSNTAYIATFYAATGLCHGLSTLWGGALFDRFGKTANIAHLGWNYYQAAFVLGWAGYLVGVVLLLRLSRKLPTPGERL